MVDEIHCKLGLVAAPAAGWRCWLFARSVGGSARGSLTLVFRALWVLIPVSSLTASRAMGIAFGIFWWPAISGRRLRSRLRLGPFASQGQAAQLLCSDSQNLCQLWQVHRFSFSVMDAVVWLLVIFLVWWFIILVNGVEVIIAVLRCGWCFNLSHVCLLWISLARVCRTWRSPGRRARQRCSVLARIGFTTFGVPFGNFTAISTDNRRGSSKIRKL